MNERIKKIVEQTTQEFSPAFEIDKWQEKFAELIVRECGKIAEDITYESEGFTFEIDTKLLRHFGVKE